MTYVITGRNVCETYEKGVSLIQHTGDRQDSRNGEVLVMDSPVMTVTECPMERVLTDPSRRANPFFHLFECLWMLYRSNDATWLDRFVGDFSSRFAQEDGVMHGAYGHRWRYHFQQDQLSRTIAQLRADPLDRRVVISMWDDRTDAAGQGAIRDVPCNTHIYPRIVNGALELTVCCRSNDVVWGCYGANAVHFSFLQEYLAGMIGVEVGRMYQLSNNWHVYTNTLEIVTPTQPENLYEQGIIGPYTIFDDDVDKNLWMADLETFMTEPWNFYKHSFFTDVAMVMFDAHNMWKSGQREEALRETDHILASDWRHACQQWMKDRLK